MIIFQAGDVFAGRFRLEERVGQGGMGQVWRATQLGLNREVAIKLILPNVDGDARFRQMFFLEAQISSRLAHPNIVPVVDFGEHEAGMLWLVQIFVRGHDLGGVLDRAPNGLPVPVAAFVITQVLLGLQCAHDHGVVHRDLKPGNVLISHAGDVQITDFGIAKVIIADQTPSISTVLKGSPGYLAPEVLRGQPARFVSDLFSVGGLLWELLTGRNPFVNSPSADREQIFYATLNHEVPQLGSVGIQAPAGLDDIVQKLLAKNPANRYQTASQALEDLLAVMAPLSREVTPIALRKFLNVTKDTFITNPISPSDAGDATPQSMGISGMAGQMAMAASSPAIRRPSQRRPRRAVAIATLTLTGAVATAVALIVLWSARSTNPPPVDGTDTFSTAPIEVTPRVGPEGRIIVDVSPSDARLSVDGSLSDGTEPYTILHRRVGTSVVLRAERPGYSPVEKTVVVEPTTHIIIDLPSIDTLTPKPAAGEEPPAKMQPEQPKPEKKVRPPRPAKTPDTEEVLPI